jgi:hypothetical protein
LALAACCGSASPAVRHAAAATPAVSELAIGSWTVEEFGADVAVLRSGGGPTDPNGHAVDLLLSCSGPDRRVRLLLSPPVAGRMGGGWAAVATIGRANRRLAVAPFRYGGGTTELTGSGTSTGDIAVAIARTLLTKPPALDIVLAGGSGPVAFTRLKVVRVLLSFRPEDNEAVTRFVAACGRFPAAQAR